MYSSANAAAAAGEPARRRIRASAMRAANGFSPVAAVWWKMSDSHRRDQAQPAVGHRLHDVVVHDEDQLPLDDRAVQ